MNILRSTLSENLSLVLDSINEADYIAFDTEFTGLSDGLVRTHQYDSLQDRYLKIKSTIEQFWICQLGLATFKFDAVQDSYIAQVFNIYMHPAQRKLAVSISSMKFLVENEFNMNLLFKDGISCAREGAECWNDKDARFGCFTLSDGNKQIMIEYERQILEFIQSDGKSMNITMPNLYIKKTFFGSHGVSQKFKYLEIKADKTNPLLILLKKGKKVPLYLPKGDTPDSPQAEPSISLIIKTLLSRNVPLIGHYMVLDLAYFYDHFIGPLPNTVEEFRLAILTNFPPIYDTKYIAKTVFGEVKFMKKTSVEDLFAYCKKRKELNNLVKIGLDERIPVAKQAHDAGYDAYMTGYIFLTLFKYAKSPEEMNTALGKVCLQGHYKECIDLNIPVQDDCLFPNVIKLLVPGNVNICEIAKEMSKYADNFIVQESLNAFFVEFYEIDERIEEVVEDINNGQVCRAARYANRILIVQ